MMLDWLKPSAFNSCLNALRVCVLEMKILALCKAARLNVLLGAVQIAQLFATSSESDANTICLLP